MEFPVDMVFTLGGLARSLVSVAGLCDKVGNASGSETSIPSSGFLIRMTFDRGVRKSCGILTEVRLDEDERQCQAKVGLEIWKSFLFEPRTLHSI